MSRLQELEAEIKKLKFIQKYGDAYSKYYDMSFNEFTMETQELLDHAFILSNIKREKRNTDMINRGINPYCRIESGGRPATLCKCTPDGGLCNNCSQLLD